MATLIQMVIDATSVGALYSLYALGIALIFGVMRLINFAYGELIMITGYALYVMSNVSPSGAITAAVGLAVVASIIMERIAFRPVRGADPVTLLVTSFAVSYLFQSGASLVFTATPRSVSLLPSLATPLDIGPIAVPKLSIAIMAVTALLLGGLALLLKRTTLGIQMRAAAEDFGMSRLLGVSANTVIGAGFLISGLIAGCAGVLYVVQTGTVTPTMGVTPVLVAFVATIVGGLGSLVGAAIGGMALGIVQVVLQLVLPDGLLPYRDALVFLFILLVLVVRPAGLIVPASQLQRV